MAFIGSPPIDQSIICNLCGNFKSKTKLFEGLTHKPADWDLISMISRDHHHAMIQLPNQYAVKLISKRLVKIKGMSYIQTTLRLQHRNLLS